MQTSQGRGNRVSTQGNALSVAGGARDNAAHAIATGCDIGVVGARLAGARMHATAAIRASVETGFVLGADFRGATGLVGIWRRGNVGRRDVNPGVAVRDDGGRAARGSGIARVTARCHRRAAALASGTPIVAVEAAGVRAAGNRSGCREQKRQRNNDGPKGNGHGEPRKRKVEGIANSTWSFTDGLPLVQWLARCLKDEGAFGKCEQFARFHRSPGFVIREGQGGDDGHPVVWLRHLAEVDRDVFIEQMRPAEWRFSNDVMQACGATREHPFTVRQ